MEGRAVYEIWIGNRVGAVIEIAGDTKAEMDQKRLDERVNNH